MIDHHSGGRDQHEIERRRQSHPDVEFADKAKEAPADGHGQFEIENEIQFQYVSLNAAAAMVKKIRHATIEIDGNF
jgi:hypothetical protein